MVQAGIDTWSPCWYVQEGSGAERAMRALATVPARRSLLLPAPIEGHRVGWFPRSRLIFAEGHPGGPRLGCPDDLPGALNEIEQTIKDYGIPLPSRRARSIWRGDQTADQLPGFAGVRRCDATVDLQPGSPAQGLAILAGVAAVARNLPGGKANVHVSGPFIETVEMRGHGGRRILGRFYDKGIESGTFPRGQLLRPEDQRRYERQTRRSVEELSTAYVREKFRQRFAPLWRASRGITVGGPVVMASKLGDLVAKDELTPAAARSLAGHLLLEPAGVPQGSARTRRHLRAQARAHGLIPHDGLLQDVEVNLHAALEEALETDAWSRRA